MRYPKEHKEQARQKLLTEAARHAKQHGFAASGVDALAGAAGVTIGSLYKHFDTKGSLFVELLRNDIGRTVQRFDAIAPGDTEALLKTINQYLSMQHVRAPQDGCPLPVLAGEIARSSDEVRDATQEGLLALKDILARHAGSDEAAWAIIAQSVGAVMLARTMPGLTHQRALLEAVRKGVVGQLEKAAEVERGA